MPRTNLDVTPAPRWSLSGLRALIGHACIAAPHALNALHGRQRNLPSACALLFASIEAALRSDEWRRALDGLLAGLLADEAEPFACYSLYELAAVHATRDRLSQRRRLALLWTLGRHPCCAARRIEERVARDLERAGPRQDAGTSPVATSAR